MQFLGDRLLLSVCLSVMLVYCGKRVGWIKMELCTEVDLGPGHIVLHGDPAPQFSAHVCCGQIAGWIKMPLGTEVGLGPGDIVLDGGPSRLKRGTAPTFRPMSIVAKRSPISATAEHLLILKIAAIRHLGYSEVQIFSCRYGGEGRFASPCQIWW